MSLKELSLTYYNRIKTINELVCRTDKLLDAGCSDGFIDDYLKRKSKKVFGIDINSNDIETAKALHPKNSYLVGSLYQLPYNKKFFDTVVCIDVLEHLEDDKKALTEFFRVLKKNGNLLITVPSKNFPFAFDPINFLLKLINKRIKIGIWGFGHIRLYSDYELKEKLIKIGFSHIKIYHFSHPLVGLFENSYLINFLQPLTKSDPFNKEKTLTDISRLKKSLLFSPPCFLKKIRDIIIYLDQKYFTNSKYSVNICIIAKK